MLTRRAGRANARPSRGGRRRRWSRRRGARGRLPRVARRLRPFLHAHTAWRPRARSTLLIRGATKCRRSAPQARRSGQKAYFAACFAFAGRETSTSDESASSTRRAAGHGPPVGQSFHQWSEVALRDVTVDRRTGAVERHGKIEYRVNALELAARVVHALTYRLMIDSQSLGSTARRGRHRVCQCAEAGGARARRAWPRRRQSAMETHRRARCPALTLLPVTIRTTSSPTTSRESASPSRNRSWRLGPPPQACARRQAARANGCTRG